jgi:diaminopimelate decarboxylase
MTYRNLRYLCAAICRAEGDFSQPAFAIYNDHGRVLRFGTDRTAMLKLFNRAYDRIPGLHISAVWAQNDYQPVADAAERALARWEAANL